MLGEPSMISETPYVFLPVSDAYRGLKCDFSIGSVSKFRTLIVGTIVTLLVPLKVTGCLLSLLLNYAYLPVSLVAVGLVLLLRKIGLMDPVVKSTHTTMKDTYEEINVSDGALCFLLAGFWPCFASHIMAKLTIAGKPDESTYIAKLHFVIIKLTRLIIGLQQST
ncbi:MAG: hypothetical protein LBS68_01845 [Puniceicoccales bacterium]|nr:hypothetical protein [Puniceicoccales bacterium]